jgi:hypothetical protein
MLAVAISGSTAPLDLARSGTGMTSTTNLALGAAPLGQRLAVRLPGVEHGRRQHEHLPGGRRRHLAGHARRRRPADVADPHADAGGARQQRRRHLDDAGRLGDVHVELVDR